MRIDGSAGNSKVSITDRCRWLKLVATCRDEAAFLAALLRAMTFGGSVTVAPRGGRGSVIEFPPMTELDHEAAS